MKRFFKWFAGGFIIILLIGFGAFYFLKQHTKQFSPEAIEVYQKQGFDIKIVYSRPFKKERVIFGDTALVPYGVVWRTGANEATQFITQTDLFVKDELLPAGIYTLWTIPGEKSWQVIFNEGEYGWGVGWDQKALREPELDVVSVRVPVQKGIKVLEQFTIDIEGDPTYLRMAWDNTVIHVPLSLPEN